MIATVNKSRKHAKVGAVAMGAAALMSTLGGGVATAAPAAQQAAAPSAAGSCQFSYWSGPPNFWGEIVFHVQATNCGFPVEGNKICLQTDWSVDACGVADRNGWAEVRNNGDGGNYWYVYRM